MLISITSHREPEPLDLSAFERLAAFVLDREDAPAELRALHRRRRPRRDDRAQRAVSRQGRARPTCSPSGATTRARCSVPTSPSRLGDVVIAPEVAEAQAAEYGHTVEEELNLLLVHGVLHLLGYDHEDDDDAERDAGARAGDPARLVGGIVVAPDGAQDPFASSGASTTRSRASSTRCGRSATCASTSPPRSSRSSARSCLRVGPDLGWSPSSSRSASCSSPSSSTPRSRRRSTSRRTATTRSPRSPRT